MKGFLPTIIPSLLRGDHQTNADYEDMMKLTEELVASVAGRFWEP